MRLLIIGNGIAALSAAETFRKYNSETEIQILSADSYPTYYRIKLSHYLGKPDFKEAELLVKDAAWYQEKGITVKLETPVARIDFAQKEVVTASGERYGYDQLLLANGAHPFLPPITGSEKAGVFALRSLDDLKTILTYLKDKKRVVVIGGGLLGLEAAHGLLELGKEVSVLEFFGYLLPRQLDPELSHVVQKELEAEGLSFILGTGCEAVLGDEHVEAVHLSDGRVVPADAVIISAGVRPNTALYQGTSLTVNKGVVVDDHMRTNLPDVYAAGDIAEYQGTVFGLWTASNDQGKVAGSNLAGTELTYASPQLVATLNIGGVKLFSAGDVADPDDIISHREGNAFHRLFIRDGRVVGAVLTGDLALMMKARNLVLKKAVVPEAAAGEDLFTVLMQ